MTLPFTVDGLFIATLLLVIVTVWYAWATDKTRKIMVKDYELKTTPLLEFKTAIIISRSWEEFIVSQTIINTGVSFVIVEKAKYIWGLKVNESLDQAVFPDHDIPYYLAPSGSVTFSFTIPVAILQSMQHGKLISASELIDGIIEYEYRGIDKLIHNKSEKPHHSISVI